MAPGADSIDLFDLIERWALKMPVDKPREYSLRTSITVKRKDSARTARVIQIMGGICEPR